MHIQETIRRKPYTDRLPPHSYTRSTSIPVQVLEFQTSSGDSSDSSTIPYLFRFPRVKLRARLVDEVDEVDV
jgi:hypothetical protein